MKPHEDHKENQGRIGAFMGKLLSHDGPVSSHLDSFSNFIILNVLCVLCSLPLVTAGASIAAACQSSFNLLRSEGGGGVFLGYFRAWKRYFRRATPVWLIMCCLFALFVVEFEIAGLMEGEMRPIFRCVMTVLILIWLAIFVYAFPLLVRTKLSRRKVIKYAAILAVANLPQTVLMVFIAGIPLLVLYLFPIAFGMVALLMLLLWVEGSILVNCAIVESIFHILEKEDHP